MTAKEYFIEELSGEPLHQDIVIEAMIEFAKHHVKQALKSVETKVTDSFSIFNENDMCKTYYPLENIK